MTNTDFPTVKISGLEPDESIEFSAILGATRVVVVVGELSGSFCVVNDNPMDIRNKLTVDGVSRIIGRLRSIRHKG